MWRILIVLFFVCQFSAFGQTVLENESSIILNDTSAEINLVIDNPNQTFNDKILLELVDTQGVVRQTSTSSHRIKNGKETYKLTLPLGDLMKTDEKNIAWFRLRYRIGDSRGIISINQIIKDIFEIRVISSEELFSGMKYRSRIRAINPFSNTSVEGVKVSAEIEIELKDNDEDKKLKLSANGETDNEGFANLEFQIPIDANLADSKITVIGKKNGIVREASEDLSGYGDSSSFLMLTDKPIYQPEQMLNVRGILLKGTEGKVVVADSEVEFRIEDEENTVLYREKVKTSEFGIAAITWKIPENAKLGKYIIRVKNQTNSEGEYAGYQVIKVSRYDLPNFAVSAKALKTFYLPDEMNAEVEVNADYLFGKPVTKGKVRVVRENEKKWNWKEQKYDIDEGESHDGNTDETGKYKAKFDLKDAHKSLKENTYRKFTDLNFTAYFTDLTTNRTEQRRFDVRVTREPIHVYFIGNRDDKNPNLPINAYVTTFYADGSPAVCDVELKGREENGDDEKYRTIQKVKTNSYGVGKLSFYRPKFEDIDDDLEIEIIAKDKNILIGTFGGENYDRYDDDINFDDADYLQIQNERTIFRPGEAVKIKLNSTKQTGLVYVDVVKDWSVVDSYFVNLKNGKAELKIPYNPKFQGVLKLAAYFEVTKRNYNSRTQKYDGEEYLEFIKTSRGIIFPTQENLQVSANFDKETYKPSEEAKVNFSVLDSVGQAVNSALGVVIFDKAVEERARTDSEFSGMFANFYGWLGYGESLAGVNIKDLNSLDLSKPISDEMQLVAEAMLYDETYYPNIFRSNKTDTDAKSVYADFFKKQFEPLEIKLADNYKTRNFEHPIDDLSLRKILSEKGINFDELNDPWEQKYRAVFEVDKVNDILRIVSAGADKKFDTKDDLTISSLSFVYFTPTGNSIDKAVTAFHKRTGTYIRDEKTLFAELGITEMKDRFGRPYQFKFEVSGRYYQLRIRSFGANGVDCDCSYDDDFNLYLSQQDYFAETDVKINQILRNAKSLPETLVDFVRLLKENDVELDKIRDGYGEKVYLQKTQFSKYTDKVSVENVQKYGEEKARQKTIIKPVTQEIIAFTLRSKGLDRNLYTNDDFTITQFLLIISEQSKNDKKPVVQNIFLNDGTGSIQGIVTDSQGAIIPNANITATNEILQTTRNTTSNDEGNFTIANLAAGTYSVRADANGFKSSVRSNVPVTANNTVKIDFTMEVGSVSSVVDITASSADIVESTSSRIENSVSASQIVSLPINGRNFLQLVQLQPGATTQEKEAEQNSSQKSTPKLREYFPETLVWSPELITNADGKAELKFKMADNITTWKLYTIASTKNGKIGVAEKEVQAFQPFFVDLDPPKFLTEDDEIYLPTQVRNYTPTKQKVDITMSKSDWFSFLESEPRAIATGQIVQNGQTQKIEVAKNAASNAIFGFKAIMPIKDGKQRVTAIAQGKSRDSDAIEKPVTVRPNGEEIVRSESKLFANSAQFEVNFPENMLPKTNKAELKIYPNLMSHVTESVEGLLQRPYGCGEQTISSTYPNLMILKFGETVTKRLGDTEKIVASQQQLISASIVKQAKKNLKLGYERLLGYQIADGGFSYWGGKDSSDIALTAYALRFLNDAKSKIEVDEKVIENATNYLIKQQREDGSFTKKYYYETNEDLRRNKLFTSYVARTLAMIGRNEALNELVSNEPNTLPDGRVSALKKIDTLTNLRVSTLEKALNYLKSTNSELDEPYTLALYALASFDAGNIVEAEKTVERLQNLAKVEGNTVYWNLETNTPFYGWGTAGRIETSALVLQALLKDEGGRMKDENKNLISKATMFLLKYKDRYGVWYSTQTTINVLDAFLASLSESKNQTISVKLNGEKLQEFAVSAVQIEPIIIPLSDKLSNANRLDITSSENSALMSQIVKTHYIDWKNSESTNRSVNDSRAIRLDYKCDKLNAKIMENITCSVEAERIGFKGYGMLLAEIGIPPGANVSRESLEEAFKNDWSLSRYDILPDRIVVYMWAKAGGSKFNFSFKPRYGINAQTPASIIYDYYNEESRGVVSPLRFVVK